MTRRSITLRVVHGDVTEFEADVVVLKYAQESYGADRIVSQILVSKGIHSSDMRPKEGKYSLVRTLGGIKAPLSLFLGVQHIWRTDRAVPTSVSIGFGYSEIREFARRAIQTLAEAAPETKHLATTVHGVGHGLNESDAFRSLVFGFLDSVNLGRVGVELRLISIVESKQDRLNRLHRILGALLPSPSQHVSSSSCRLDDIEPSRAGR